MEVTANSGDKGFSVSSIPVLSGTLFPEDVKKKKKVFHSQINMGNSTSEFTEHIRILQALMISHLINLFYFA